MEIDRFVVLGFPRSGTTLLTRLLSAHPDISCPPETNILNACGRFLKEESATEGPPIGVLSGLEFLDINSSVVLDHLRHLFFSIHDTLADGKPIKVEKSGFDIFYIDEIEKLLSDKCKFICLYRNPLDVCASLKGFVETIGTLPPELHHYSRYIPNPIEAYSQAWVDSNNRLLELVESCPEMCCEIKYEELVATPLDTMKALCKFIGVPEYNDEILNSSFSQNFNIGLGDWKIHETNGISTSRKDKWKSTIGKVTASRIAERTKATASRLGYEPPKLSKLPDRDRSMKQYIMAKRLKQSSVSQPE